MKFVYLFCLLCLLSVQAQAGVIRCLPVKVQTSSRSLPRVSWKHVAAGGAAAGTMIAAYKVSNGIEDGIRRSAEKDPKSFNHEVGSFFSPIRWLLIAGIVFIGCLAVRKLSGNSNASK